MQDLIDWMGDIWFVDETTTTHSVGYVSERYSYSGSTQIIKLPYEDTTTVSTRTLNYPAVAAFVLVALVFVTVVTTVRSAILK